MGEKIQVRVVGRGEERDHKTGLGRDNNMTTHFQEVCVWGGVLVTKGSFSCSQGRDYSKGSLFHGYRQKMDC